MSYEKTGLLYYVFKVKVTARVKTTGGSVHTLALFQTCSLWTQSESLEVLPATNTETQQKAPLPIGIMWNYPGGDGDVHCRCTRHPPTSTPPQSPFQGFPVPLDKRDTWVLNMPNKQAKPHVNLNLVRRHTPGRPLCNHWLASERVTNIWQ